jgi:hypothetical membrane protein
VEGNRGPQKRDDRAVRLAWGAIAGIVVFNAGWILAGTLQSGGYSVAKHDVSDLGALTAQYPWVVLIAGGIAGVLTIVFALFALRPALAAAGRAADIGSWLLAASLMGLDNVSDVFFRLDCRAADRGCSTTVATGSWHGTVHLAVGTVSGVATVVTPFVLVRCMRRVDGWRDLARPTQAFVLAFLVVLASYAVLEGKTGGGYLQRVAIVLLSMWIAMLAFRVRALAEQPHHQAPAL